jgi:hypothetical protein
VSSEAAAAATALLVLVSAGGAAVADDPSFKPGIQDLLKGAMQFDGQSSVNLVLDPPMVLEDGVTVETWLSANWKGVATTAPCFISLSDDKGVLFSAGISADRRAIIVQSGSDVIAYPVAMNPAVINFVAIEGVGDYWQIIFNGEISGLIPFTPPSGTATRLDLGACNGQGAGFPGWLAETRVWNFALDVPDIIDFVPVTGDLADQDHPFLPLLRAQLTAGATGPALVARNGTDTE